MGRSRLPAHLRAMIPAAEAHARKKRERKPRPAYWPPGVDSELEMALLTRLERAGLPLGVTQHRFIEGRQFRFDRAWPAQMVAVEVTGGIWMAKSGHNTGTGIERDCAKLCLAAATGWRVLPITKAMIESDEAVALIAQALGAAADDRRVSE